MKTWFVFLTVLISGCVLIPDNVEVVKGFNVLRYLGTWYEIARLDHSFERGLSNVSATYTLRKDGGIKVLNQGYDTKRKKWKQAEGKAYFVSGTDVGRLKVSFFGPFYGGYNVIDLDKKDYSYSLVCGPNFSYLWILARDKKLGGETLSKLINEAKNLGFETGKLIFVKQSDQKP